MKIPYWLQKEWYSWIADFPLRIEQMTEQQIVALERRMRPGSHETYGSLYGFLSETDSLREIVERFERTLQNLNITPDELATRLEKKITTATTKIGSMGDQYCPWGDGFYANGGPPIEAMHGEQIPLTLLYPHMIRFHHFPEGNVKHGIEGKRLVAYARE